MTVWAYVQNTEFCDSWVEERIFNGVIGVIYIFCFFNLKEGNSRYRITIFYCVMFAENVCLVTLWYVYKVETTWYDPVGFGVVFGGFVIGKNRHGQNVEFGNLIPRKLVMLLEGNLYNVETLLQKTYDHGLWRGPVHHQYIKPLAYYADKL